MTCWDRFDGKTVLYFTGNKGTRVPMMEKELARVGLDDAVRQWQFPTPLDNVVRSNVQHSNGVKRDGYFNCSMGHYRAIATAYYRGLDHALFIEDDIRFLKDVDAIEQAVNDLPDDYDLAMLDWFCIKKKDGSGIGIAKRYRDERRVNRHWSEFDKFYSAGCYALSRKGMERIMLAIELSATDKKIGMFRIIDHYMDRNVIGAESRLYFASTNIAIQRQIGASNSSGYDIAGKYRSLGIRLEDYAEA